MKTAKTNKSGWLWNADPGLNFNSNRTWKLGKMIIKYAIDYGPRAYKKLKGKIKKNVKAALNTDVGGYVVNRGNDLIGELFN